MFTTPERKMVISSRTIKSNDEDDNNMQIDNTASDKNKTDEDHDSYSGENMEGEDDKFWAAGGGSKNPDNGMSLGQDSFDDEKSEKSEYRCVVYFS